jgi:hypothetical protein
MTVQQTALFVCGGMHLPSATGQILAILASDRDLSRLTRLVVAPQQGLGVLSAFALRQTLETAIDAWGPASGSAPGNALGANAGTFTPRLIIWAFSAGCVGAAALATYWQRWRGPVQAIFLVDGWGVPCPPMVPTYRLSHDRFTHDTSGLLGPGEVNFYAEPAVPHRDLWQHPQAVTGWSVGPGQRTERLTAADFLLGRSRALLTPTGNAPVG